MLSPLLKFAALVGIAGLVIGWHPAKTRTSPPLIEPAENVNMYLYDTLLFVSNQALGILVYSVRDTLHPRLLQTVPVRENRGMAFKDSILYADSRGSLLALRLYQDTLFQVTKVIERGYYGWEGDGLYYDDMESHGCACIGATSADYRSDASAPASGTGGSYAVFAVIDSFLYYLSQYELVTLSIADPANPIEKSRVHLGWNVETLFPTERHLFVGTRTGMQVYSRSNPAHPNYLGDFQHARSCDPVVVRDTLAFVTLRSGGFCGSWRDELISLSIANPSYPLPLDTLSVVTPWGLAVRDSLLYVSNGTAGFTLISAAEPRSLVALHAWTAPKTRDFIWDRDRLFIMGEDHLSLYNTQDPRNPVLVVKIQ